MKVPPASGSFVQRSTPAPGPVAPTAWRWGHRQNADEVAHAVTRRTGQEGRGRGVGQSRWEKLRFSSVTTTLEAAAINKRPIVCDSAISRRCSFTINITAGMRNAEATMTHVRPYFSIIGTRDCAKYAYSPSSRYATGAAGTTVRPPPGCRLANRTDPATAVGCPIGNCIKQGKHQASRTNAHLQQQSFFPPVHRTSPLLRVPCQLPFAARPGFRTLSVCERLCNCTAAHLGVDQPSITDVA